MLNKKQSVSKKRRSGQTLGTMISHRSGSLDRGNISQRQNRPTWYADTSIDSSTNQASRIYYSGRKPRHHGISRIRRELLRRQLNSFENRPFDEFTSIRGSIAQKSKAFHWRSQIRYNDNNSNTIDMNQSNLYQIDQTGESHLDNQHYHIEQQKKFETKNSPRSCSSQSNYKNSKCSQRKSQ